MGSLFIVEIEQQILGTILLNNSLADEVEARWFCEGVHMDIMEVIHRRLADGEPVSPMTLGFEMDKVLSDVGGRKYLVSLAGYSSETAFKENIRELKNLWARRTVAATLEDSLQSITTFDQFQSPEKAISDIENAIATVTTVATRKPLVESSLAGMTDAISEAVQAKAQSGIVGTSTGVGILDRKIGGMAAGDMIVLAGRPSMGKTAIALGIAWNVAKRGQGVFFASLEMPKAQIWTRFLSMEMHLRGYKETHGPVPYFNLRTGRVTDETMELAGIIAKENMGIPILTAEKEGRNISRLRSASRKASQMFASQGTPLGLVVIDYLQLVEGERGMSDYARVSAASNMTKSLALDLGVPVLVLSQLNRGVEQRDEPIPRLSDLRESGKVEEDADIVMLAYRKDYYIQKKLDEGSFKDIDEEADLRAQLSQARDQAQLLIPKARGGPTGEVTIGYRPHTNLIWER